jgi:AmmeMemoRadiSam system protein B
MKSGFRIIWLCLAIVISVSCQPDKKTHGTTRLPVDTIGFAQHSWQMDSIMARIETMYLFEEYHPCDDKSDDPAKIVISPHDDYTYVGPIYPSVIHQIKSRIVIMFGVAHKASLSGLEDKIIFDSYSYWKGPYKDTHVSGLREEIMAALDVGMYTINDSIHKVEHSLEALIPYLQYFNKKVEIVPILVPSMSFDRMKLISESLADVIFKSAKQDNLEWGRDFAIIISNDAVHYGDEDWGGNNYAPFGADTAGYTQAINHEMRITSCTLCGTLNPDSIRRFNEFTVQSGNFKEYKWTWCGRYSVPLGLLTGYNLAELFGESLYGTTTGYMTSIDHPPVPVKDLGMGSTAPASLRHWVGYVGIVYK